MKNIIKRIIVGVAIGMILYFLKGIAFIDVYAMETGFITPNYLRVYADNSESGLTPLTFNYGGKTMYGNQFGSTAYRTRITWDFSSNLSLNTPYDFSFYFYADAKTNADLGVRGFIEDNSNFINSCYIDSSRYNMVSGNTSLTQLDPLIVVTCNDVVLKNKNFSFSIYAIATNPSGVVAVSPISYKTSSTSEIIQQNEETNEQLQDMNDTINSDDTSESEDEATSFFDDFENEDHGLTGIITAPLRLINSLASSSCSPLTFPLPFVDSQVSLPCMKPIYQEHFSSFLAIYQIITTGLIGYWISVKIFAHVKGFKNPEEDKVEVLDL